MALPDWLRNFTTEGDGTWTPGKAYSFELRGIGRGNDTGSLLYDTSGGSLTGNWLFKTDIDHDVAVPGYTLDLVSDVEDPPGTHTFWYKISFTLPENFVSGAYLLLFDTFLDSTFDPDVRPQFGTITDNYPVTVGTPVPAPFVPTPVVPDRPIDYDPDLRWDEETQAWLDIQAAGGGAYKDQLILVGDGGEIFIGDI